MPEADPSASDPWANGASAPTPLEPGAPVVIVANPASGAGAAGDAVEAARVWLRQAGRPCEVLLAPQPGALESTARRAVSLAASFGGAVVAAGGDGSARTVVDALLDHARENRVAPRPLGVLPMGTFNYFARAQGLPEDPEAAARIWLQGRTRAVQVGCIDNRAFLVHAALGLYPRLLEDREAFKQRYGRTRWVALWAGLRSLVRGGATMRLDITRDDGRHETIAASTLFAGNNRLQLERIGVEQAPCVEQGQLAVLWLRPSGVWQRLWIALRGAVGELGGADAVRSEALSAFVVEPRRRWRRRPMKVALDGEVMRIAAPLHFAVSKVPISLLAPPAREPGTAAA
jgi:diacylglycerol kinase family enzyme